MSLEAPGNALELIKRSKSLPNPSCVEPDQELSPFQVAWKTTHHLHPIHEVIRISQKVDVDKLAHIPLDIVAEVEYRPILVNISIHVTSPWTSTTSSLLVSATDSIESVKAKLVAVRNIPHKWSRLYLNGEMLSNHKNLFFYGISAGTRLHLKFPLDDGMIVWVVLMHGSSIAFDVWRSDTIGSLKTMFYCKRGVPPDLQRLIFGGKELEDGRTLGDYNIQNESHLYQVLRLRGGGPGTTSETTRLAVKLSTGVTVFIVARPGSTIAAICSMLREEVNAERNQRLEIQRLWFQNQLLNDPNRTLGSFGIIIGGKDTLFCDCTIQGATTLQG